MGFYGDFMKSYGIYPLVNVYITLERSTMLLVGKVSVSTGSFSIANCYSGMIIDLAIKKSWFSSSPFATIVDQKVIPEYLRLKRVDGCLVQNGWWSTEHCSFWMAMLKHLRIRVDTKHGWLNTRNVTEFGGLSGAQFVTWIHLDK